MSIVRKKIQQSYPQLIKMAFDSQTLEQFKTKFEIFIHSFLGCRDDELEELRQAAADHLLRLIEYDGRTINELSTGETMAIHTILYFWYFLRNEITPDVSEDPFIDLYAQLKRLTEPIPVVPNKALVKKQMSRWPSGLDEKVMTIRAQNKDRIIKLLIKKIERRRATPTSRYVFEEGLSFDEKYKQVEQWWESSRFHLSMAIKTIEELNYFLGNTLSKETLSLYEEAKSKRMPIFVTPYYLSLLDTTGQGYDDQTIRSYVIYSRELVETYGHIKAWEKEDIVEPGKPNAAGWILPNESNVHRRYPEVAILIPDSMGRACGGLCASCQRMYDFQSERLNFELESLKPKETWDKKLRRLMDYFEEDTQLRDILITGGDALMSQNATLRKILDAVYKMAIRKKKANESRPDGEKYAEIVRVRLGTRLPAYLPCRITDELTDMLREFKEKASAIGISQFYIQTHFQSPLEVTSEAKRAIEKILDAGWVITNQLVYTVAASRRGHTAKLRQTLNSVGVVCYYTFSVKGFQENYAVFTPNARSLQAEKEEKVFGALTREQKEELNDLIYQQKDLKQNIKNFLKKYHLPFASTDRNVLNLPAIGKSMTFKTVGLTEDGKRILKFKHDTSRHHSPIIDQMGDIYIVENKSIAAYLRQLKDMGESTSEYTTIWNYTEGTTEPRFRIYDYPAYPFKITDRMTNLDI